MQAAAAYGRGAALALGLAAATIAFLSSVIIGLWLAFTASTLTDGEGVALSVSLAFIVGAVGFIAALIFQGHRRVLAGIEVAAGATMVAAVICVALDGGDLHWQDAGRVSMSFLYWLWGLVAILFLLGAVVALRAPEG